MRVPRKDKQTALTSYETIEEWAFPEKVTPTTQESGRAVARLQRGGGLKLQQILNKFLYLHAFSKESVAGTCFNAVPGCTIAA
jgi:hypothetical protein